MKKAYRLIFSLAVILLYTLHVNAQKQNSIEDIIGLMKNYKFNEAILIADKLIELDSLNLELYLFKAKALKEQFRYADALKVLKYGLDLDSNNVSILSEMASVYKLCGDNQNTYEIYSILLILDPGNSYFKILIANTLIVAKAYASAKDIFLELIKADSLNPFLLRQAGMCYSELNNLDSAEFFYNSVFEINKSDFVSVLNLANIYILTKKYEKGLKLTENYRLMDSTKNEINKWCGYFNYLNQQYIPAIERFNEYLAKCAVGETSKFANKYMGMALYKTENFQSAADYFLKAYKADTTDFEVGFYLGTSHCRSFSSDTGIFYLTKTIETITPSPSFLSIIYTEMANAYNNKKRYDTATVYTIKAYQTDTANKAMLFKLAYQYDYILGDKKNALKYFKEYIVVTHDSNATSISQFDYAKNRILYIENEKLKKNEKDFMK